MTEAMPFLQKAILLSYDPRPFRRELFFSVPFKFPLFPATKRPRIPFIYMNAFIFGGSRKGRGPRKKERP